LGDKIGLLIARSWRLRVVNIWQPYSG